MQKTHGSATAPLSTSHYSRGGATIPLFTCCYSCGGATAQLSLSLLATVYPSHQFMNLEK
jgi:hypothetical protein